MATSSKDKKAVSDYCLGVDFPNTIIGAGAAILTGGGRHLGYCLSYSKIWQHKIRYALLIGYRKFSRLVFLMILLPKLI
jgi:hypothetical protein